MSFSEWIDKTLGAFGWTKVAGVASVCIILSTTGFNIDIYGYYTGLEIENKISLVFIVSMVSIAFIFVYFNDKINQLRGCAREHSLSPIDVSENDGV